MSGLLAVAVVCLLTASTSAPGAGDSPWTWTCDHDGNHGSSGDVGVCRKVEVAGAGDTEQRSLAECTLTCSPSTTLWPLPEFVQFGELI